MLSAGNWNIIDSVWDGLSRAKDDLKSINPACLTLLTSEVTHSDVAYLFQELLIYGVLRAIDGWIINLIRE